MSKSPLSGERGRSGNFPAGAGVLLRTGLAVFAFRAQPANKNSAESFAPLRGKGGPQGQFACFLANKKPRMNAGFFILSQEGGSNPRPTAYEAVALPAELSWRKSVFPTTYIFYKKSGFFAPKLIFSDGKSTRLPVVPAARKQGFRGFSLKTLLPSRPPGPGGSG